MTEDEAKTKWCFAAVASHTDPRRGFEEDTGTPYPLTFPCLGSRCMAWRWTLPLMPVDGYCGLAGKP